MFHNKYKKMNSNIFCSLFAIIYFVQKIDFYAKKENRNVFKNPDH